MRNVVALCTAFAFVPCLASLVVAEEATQQLPFERVDYDFPTIDGYQVLVADFHVHTTHSDGELPPRERVLEAYLAGYDAIAITDHGSVAAYDEARELAADLGLVFVRGLESGIAGHEHYVLLGVDRGYVPRDSHQWAATPEEAQETGRAYYREQLEQVRNSGGIVVYAHPDHGWRECTQWAYEQGILVGCEVLNSCTTEGWGSVWSHGRPCYPHAFEWALNKRLAVAAFSDIHGSQGDCPPRARTLLLVEEPTPEAAVEALRDGRTLAWFPDGCGKWPESPEMLWAPREILQRYALAVTRVTDRTLRGDPPRGCLTLRNLGAVRLQVRVHIDGASEAILTLEPSKDYFVMHDPAARRMTVEWINLWRSPRRTLSAEYELKLRGGEWVWVPTAQRTGQQGPGPVTGESLWDGDLRSPSHSPPHGGYR